MQINENPSLSRRLKIYVHLEYKKDPEIYLNRFLDGKEPDESPYGFHLARDEGFDVSFSRANLKSSNKLIFRALRKIVGFDIAHAWMNRESIIRSDAIWTMTEGEAFGIAFLISVGLLPKRPIISNTVWLLNKWASISPPRRYIYTYLSRYLNVMTVHSNSCLPVARTAFPDLHSERMYFGINTDVYKIRVPTNTNKSELIHVFAPGNDRTRDWDTILAAFGNDDRFFLTIICGWLTEEQVKPYSNVRLFRATAVAEFMQCYDQADIVAVPMVENIFSGITVALEAAALGKAIVSSQTGGVPTYFDETEVFYVPVGDSAAMRDLVAGTSPESRRQRAVAAQRKFVEQDYSTRAVIGRYAELTHRVMAHSDARPLETAVG